MEGGKNRLYGGSPPRRLAAELALEPGVGYGGGAFTPGKSGVYLVSQNRLWLYRDGGARPLTPAFGELADPQPHPGGDFVAFVHHYEGRDVLALADTAGSSWPRILASGADFYMQPAWSPDGRWLAWVEWDQPNMPWDGGRLMLARFANGELSEVRQLAGGEWTPVFQPLFDAAGLYWLENPEGEEFDRLVRMDLASGRRQVLFNDAALIDPAWTQAQRVMSIGPGGSLYLRENRMGRAVLWRISDGNSEEVALPEGVFWLSGLSGDEKGLAMVASGPTLSHRVIFYDGEGWRTVAYGWPAGFDDGVEPEQVDFAGADGSEFYGLYYPPQTEEKDPPAVISVHGGPTSQRTLAFDPQPQLFSSNGYAYLELNYRGSTGYGRSYREALYGNWGVVDVADAAAAARFLSETGRAGGRRIAIIGGSAGGYTTLLALALHPGLFRAGVSFYGVTDLFMLPATPTSSRPVTPTSWWGRCPKPRRSTANARR